MGGEHGLPPSFPPSNQGLIRLFTLPGAFSVRIVSSRSLSLSLSPFMHSTPAALLLLRRVSSVVFVRAAASFFAESVGVMCRD